MVDVVVAVASKLAEYLVPPTIQQGRYLFCGAKIKRNFESEKEKLLSSQKSVQNRVEEARCKTDTIDDAVNKWLNDVESLLKDMDDLEREIKENKSCFGWWSPNWPSYCLSKQMAEKIERMVQLNANHAFNPFSHPAPIQDIEYFSSENFMYFRSTTLASNQLLETLKDTNCYMIGLYGMGGSGKTTLAKEVAKKAKESKILDHVVLTTVSQTPNVRKIQGEIADLLGVKLEDETEVGRARRISLRLKSGERILVILDDVWEKLNLEDIGIPLNSNQNSCKVLITTRRERVCTSMCCEKKIPLHLLSESEAWTLFNKHAWINDVTSQDVAREISKECKGLPIALVTTGSCINERDLDLMKVVLHKLRHSKPIDVDEGEKDVFGCLQLSYDYLRNKESKLLFLMCAVFPEDHRINPEDLLRYGIGLLNVCGQVDTFEIARSQVNVAIQVLLDSSLLMRENGTNGKAFFRMHDVVRDVALWIASKEDRTIVVNLATRQHSSLEDEAIKDCYALSWWNMDINLPQQLDAPKLEMLLLNLEGDSHDFSHTSFEGFRGIKVMAIMQRSLRYGRKASILPNSTHLLTNLHTMRLVGMKLHDISFVVSLRNLEILDFQRSKLKELPNGLEKLTKLKLLDLSYCEIDGHCYEVIKRCLQLEELYVHRKHDWAIKNKFIDSDAFCLEDVTLSKLQRYELEVGKIGNTFSNVSLCERNLYIEGLNVSTLGANIKDLVRRATKVGLIRLEGGCKNVIPELVQAVGGMNELIGLYLKSCSEIECVFNTTSLMDSSFEVNTTVQQSLLAIQELRIQYCSELKYIMTNEAYDNNRGKQIVAVPDNVYLHFSRLKKLHIHECHKLEYIFSISVVQRLEQLEEINISDAPDVKYLFSELDHEYHSSYPNEIQIVLSKLKVIRLQGLLNLVKIFPESYRVSWSLLIEFVCQNCPKTSWTGSTSNKVNLEQRHSSLNKNERNGSKSSNEVSALSCVDFEGCPMDFCFFPEIIDPIASELKTLRLKNQPELRHIWTGSAHILSLVCLENLSVHNCGKLKSLLSSVVRRSLPHLTRISIWDCEELEEIIAESEDSNNQSINDQVCFPKLKELRVERCHKLRSIFSASMVRMIPQCEKMKDGNTNKKEIVLPNLIEVRANQEISIDESKKAEAVRDGEVAREMEALQPFQLLMILGVDGCRKLRCIFSSAVIRSLPRLFRLIIKECEELEEIISLEEQGQFPNASTSRPQQPCFPQLQYLQVEGCNRLRCVFPLSISSSALPRLRSLDIRRCSQLEQVFGCVPQNHDAEMMEFQLPSLWDLQLEQLPRLTSFCRGFQSQLKLEAFRSCQVKDCPKLCSTTIPDLSDDTEAIMVSNLRRLELKNIGEVEFIWKGPTLISFQHLERLRVEGCRKLRCIFSSAVIRSLPLLKHLIIKECEELEEIISLEEQGQFPNASTSHPQQSCFPQLRYLKVEGCNKLKCVFPLSISSPPLPRLKNLEIRRCSQLEQVFGCVPKKHDAEMMEFRLPSLWDLQLEQLPRLTSFCRGFESQLKLEALLTCQVKDCPKFCSTTIPALHAILSNDDTDKNKEEEKENNIDDNVVRGDTFNNIDQVEDEDKDVNDDQKNNEVEDGEEDDKDEDIDLDINN